MKLQAVILHVKMWKMLKRFENPLQGTVDEKTDLLPPSSNCQSMFEESL